MYLLLTVAQGYQHWILNKYIITVLEISKTKLVWVLFRYWHMKGIANNKWCRWQRGRTVDCWEPLLPITSPILLLPNANNFQYCHRESKGNLTLKKDFYILWLNFLLDTLLLQTFQSTDGSTGSNLYCYAVCFENLIFVYLLYSSVLHSTCFCFADMYDSVLWWILETSFEMKKGDF